MKRLGFLGAVGLLVATVADAAPRKAAQADESAIRSVEEEFRAAKVKNDTDTIGKLVADEYYGLNQNGNARDRSQLLELFKVFKISSLSVDLQRIRVSGENAVVAGRQREVTSCGDATKCPPEISLFLRTYVRQKGRWRILTSVQFRDPKEGKPGPNTPFPHDPF